VPRGKDCLPVALRAADCLAEHPHSVLRPPLPPPTATTTAEASEGSGGGGGGGAAAKRRET
jgi:hypothetical protein